MIHYQSVMYESLFNKSGLSLDRLRRFLSVIDEGGMTKAAGGSTSLQSQMSRQIRELEEFFEVKLFRKEGKKLHLTDTGKRLEVIARECLSSLGKFMQECQSQPRTISIGAGETLLQWLLIQQLGSFKLEQTVFKLENLRSLEIIRRIQDMRLDIGLVRTDAVPSHFKKIELGSLKYSLFVPKEMLENKPNADWKEIIGTLPLAIMGSEGKFSQRLQQISMERSILMKVALECSSFPQAAKALLSRSYCAILPSIAKIDLPEEDFIQIHVPFLETETRKITLTWHPRLNSLWPDSEKLMASMSQSLIPKLG